MDEGPSAANTPEPPGPGDLILRGRTGDRQALKLLIERYQARMARFVLAETRDPNAYEDLCQTVFVKMVLGLPRLREADRFEPWLFQIARNVCRDHQRAASGWRRYFVPYGAGHDGIAMAEPELRQDDLEHGLARLSAEDRTLLQQQLEEKKSHRELARASNSTVSAVKSRLYRARRELRALLVAGDSK